MRYLLTALFMGLVVTASAVLVQVDNVVTAHQTAEQRAGYTGREGELVMVTNGSEDGTPALAVYDGITVGGKLLTADLRKNEKLEDVYYVERIKGVDTSTEEEKTALDLANGARLLAVVDEAVQKMIDEGRVEADMTTIYIEAGKYTLPSDLDLSDWDKDGTVQLVGMGASAVIYEGENDTSKIAKSIVPVVIIGNVLISTGSSGPVYYENIRIQNVIDAGGSSTANVSTIKGKNIIFDTYSCKGCFVYGSDIIIESLINTYSSVLLLDVVGRNISIGSVTDLKFLATGQSESHAGPFSCSDPTFIISAPVLFGGSTLSPKMIAPLNFNGASVLGIPGNYAVFRDCVFTEGRSDANVASGSESFLKFEYCKGVPSGLVGTAAVISFCTDETGAAIANQ